MDEFLSGRSSSFVPEAQVERPVEVGPLDAVRFPDQLDEVSRVAEDGPHVCFREGLDALV
jgi:hypothetical protein